eukprot:Mrub_06893.p1 GENE.Mrub_06893~~Mrub_06893.p1  ORF type:complete len:300 (+),score=50.85 Mrub_06893:77-901(+)
MLKYLICYIVSKIHNKNKKYIYLTIKFDSKKENDNQTFVKYSIIIEAKYDDQSNPKKILFSDYYYFNKLINNLGFDLTYQYMYNEEINSHKLDINYSSEKINKNLEYQEFDQNVLIKDDKISLQNVPNLLIYSEHSFEIKHNLIILNVDDEINIKSMHTLIFARLDIKLLCCSNGVELVQFLTAIHSHLVKKQVGASVVVLLDHVLDGQSGLQVLKEARVHQRRFGLEVVWVLVSSSEDEYTLDMYKAEGVEHVIQKPLSVEKVRELIQNYGID